MSTILVVDGERGLRAQYKKDLEADGHAVVTTGSACEALDLVESKSPELVVLDVQLPGMDGLELMGRILIRHRSLPIVLNTAQTSYKDNFLSWSADAYVVKSKDTSELRATVRELLTHHSTHS